MHSQLLLVVDGTYPAGALDGEQIANLRKFSEDVLPRLFSQDRRCLMVEYAAGDKRFAPGGGLQLTIFAPYNTMPSNVRGVEMLRHHLAHGIKQALGDKAASMVLKMHLFWAPIDSSEVQLSDVSEDAPALPPFRPVHSASCLESTMSMF